MSNVHAVSIFFVDSHASKVEVSTLLMYGFLQNTETSSGTACTLCTVIYTQFNYQCAFQCFLSNRLATTQIDWYTLYLYQLLYIQMLLNGRLIVMRIRDFNWLAMKYIRFPSTTVPYWWWCQVITDINYIVEWNIVRSCKYSKIPENSKLDLD